MSNHIRQPERPRSAQGVRTANRTPDQREMAEEIAVNDFVKVLDEHRKACEETGKYIEADVALHRVNELRIHEENRQRQALRSRQIAERVKVEEAHMMEFQQFNAEWDRRMEEYDVKAIELEEAMKQRHADDLNEFRRKAAAAALRPKFGPELLNLRKIQATLAKQKEYAEAHKVKLKADALEARELNKLNLQHQGRLGASEDKQMYKQAQELEALRQRVVAGREEHKRQRQADLQRILQRYQNVKNALEKQQAKEVAEREKKLKLKAEELQADLVHVRDKRAGGGGGGVASASTRPPFQTSVARPRTSPAPKTIGAYSASPKKTTKKHPFAANPKMAFK